MVVVVVEMLVVVVQPLWPSVCRCAWSFRLCVCLCVYAGVGFVVLFAVAWPLAGRARTTVMQCVSHGTLVPPCALCAGRGPGGYYDFCTAHGWLSRESGGKHRAACRFLPPPSPPTQVSPPFAVLRCRVCCVRRVCLPHHIR